LAGQFKQTNNFSQFVSSSLNFRNIILVINFFKIYFFACLCSILASTNWLLGHCKHLPVYQATSTNKIIIAFPPGSCCPPYDLFQSLPAASTILLQLFGIPTRLPAAACLLSPPFYCNCLIYLHSSLLPPPSYYLPFWSTRTLACCSLAAASTVLLGLVWSTYTLACCNLSAASTILLQLFDLPALVPAASTILPQQVGLPTFLPAASTILLQLFSLPTLLLAAACLHAATTILLQLYGLPTLLPAAACLHAATTILLQLDGLPTLLPAVACLPPPLSYCNYLVYLHCCLLQLACCLHYPTATIWPTYTLACCSLSAASTILLQLFGLPTLLPAAACLLSPLSYCNYLAYLYSCLLQLVCCLHYPTATI
jgi:hypothetical protein